MTKRIIGILLALCLALGALSGCRKKPHDAQTEPTAAPTEAPTAEPTATPELVPTLDPNIDRALAKAAEHGLTQNDVRGEYALFVRFSDTLEANSGLGDHRDFVYRIFPVIADHAEEMDAEAFFRRLGELRIGYDSLVEGHLGEYTDWNTSIMLNRFELHDLPCAAPGTLFHELMHFLDYTLCPGSYWSYVLDGRVLGPEETDSLTREEASRLKTCRETNFILEGGAEYISAEYLEAAPRSYLRDCAFLAGLEYVLGEGAAEELYFRRDTDGAFAKMLFDAGYSEERYFAACDSLNHMSRPDSYGEFPGMIAPEDILIDLYEANREGDWKEDAGFLYILKCVNGVALEGWKASEHADFLETIEFTTQNEYDEFCAKLLDPLPFECGLMSAPPAPVFRGGRMLIGAYARYVPEEGERRGAIIFDMDLESETLRGYALTDLDGLAERYFDLG